VPDTRCPNLVSWALVAPDRTGGRRHDVAFDVTKGLMRDTL